VRHELAGQIFGRLTVLRELGLNKHSRIVWLCACSCGNETSVVGRRLLTGRTRSCGCLYVEAISNNGKKNRIHGHAGCRNRAYASWRSMRKRCYNPKNRQYKNYGGRGIIVCERWRSSFVNFLTDMGERPEGYELDRKDPNGNYEPLNCRYIPSKSGKTRQWMWITDEIKLKRISLEETIPIGWRRGKPLK